MRKEAAPDSLGVFAWGAAFGANKRGLWPHANPQPRIISEGHCHYFGPMGLITQPQWRVGDPDASLWPLGHLGV
jgi:hypothetical protein